MKALGFFAGQGTPSPRQALAAELARQTYRMMFGLVELRGQRGLSQADVAELLGVTQQAVSKFEQMDADPKLSTVRKYALAVGAQFSIAVIPHDGSNSRSVIRGGGKSGGSTLDLAVEASDVVAPAAATRSDTVDISAFTVEAA